MLTVGSFKIVLPQLGMLGEPRTRLKYATTTIIYSTGASLCNYRAVVSRVILTSSIETNGTNVQDSEAMPGATPAS